MALKRRDSTKTYLKQTLFSSHGIESKLDPFVNKRGVSSNSIYCVSCKDWIHECWCGIKEKLVGDPSCKCGICLININAEAQISPNMSTAL